MLRISSSEKHRLLFFHRPGLLVRGAECLCEPVALLDPRGLVQLFLQPHPICGRLGWKQAVWRAVGLAFPDLWFYSEKKRGKIGEGQLPLNDISPTWVDQP